PRPHAVAHNEQYRKLIKGYMVRHKVLPGITGLAQVNGCRGETAQLEQMEARVNYDLDYLRHWSVMLDIKIILLTIVRAFRDEKAYGPARRASAAVNKPPCRLKPPAMRLAYRQNAICRCVCTSNPPDSARQSSSLISAS